MSTYEITGSAGLDLGEWPGASPEEALEAMLEAAGDDSEWTWTDSPAVFGRGGIDALIVKRPELSQAAAALGRRGGKKGGPSKSRAKRRAARDNGRLGGRPRLLGTLVLHLHEEHGEKCSLEVYLHRRGAGRELRCIDPKSPSTADADYVAMTVEDLLDQIGRDGHWTDPHAEILGHMSAALAER